MGAHLKVLSEIFPMNTKMTGFRLFSNIFASLCFGRKASALEGLSSIQITAHHRIVTGMLGDILGDVSCIHVAGPQCVQL